MSHPLRRGPRPSRGATRAIVVLAAAATLVGSDDAGATQHDNPIAAENALAGTPGWLGRPAIGTAIEVYASSTDVVPGDTLDVHVSTSPAAQYRLLVYRLGWYGGVGARLVACVPSCSGEMPGRAEPAPAPDSTGYVNAGWPASAHVPIDAGWPSGYYLVRAELESGPQSGDSATTYVVVRAPHSTSRMLLQVPVNTWQAYNGWGGKSLYPFSSADGRQAIRVSFDRPFAWTLPGG